jgi:hypothetical protein
MMICFPHEAHNSRGVADQIRQTIRGNDRNGMTCSDRVGAGPARDVASGSVIGQAGAASKMVGGVLKKSRRPEQISAVFRLELSQHECSADEARAQ